MHTPGGQATGPDNYRRHPLGIHQGLCRVRPRCAFGSIARPAPARSRRPHEGRGPYWRMRVAPNRQQSSGLGITEYYGARPSYMQVIILYDLAASSRRPGQDAATTTSSPAL